MRQNTAEFMLNHHDTMQAEVDALKAENQRLREALALILDQVDYKAGNCRSVDMVGAALPEGIIDIARNALKGDA